VLDNTAEQYKGLKEWQYHGSIYGVSAATATALRPVGEWNSETITMKGRTVKVELNGVVIVDVDLDKVAPEGKTVSGHKVDGLARTQGHIGFCGHGDRVAFRNLRVRNLDAAKRD
ncbi:MAG: 3-keto-disaccharide hydrolase, partial [Phycisphaerales bacterium]